jgi:CAAX protease family protein
MLLVDTSRRQAAIDVFVLIGGLIGIWVAMGLAMVAIVDLSPAEDVAVLRLVLTLTGGAIGAGFTLLAVRLRRQPVSSVGVCAAAWTDGAVWGCVATVGAFVALWSVTLLTTLVFPSMLESAERNVERIAEFLPPFHPGWYVLIAAAVGIYEELVFRGFLLTRIRRATNSDFAGIVGSAALFALPHAMSQEVIVVLPLFAIGVFWAVLTLWRKSILPVVVGHALFNLLQMLGMYYLGQNHP